MQEDEAKAMAFLNVFKEGLEAIVPSFDGQIVQYFGDACLLSFESTSQAVRCAIKLQPYFQKKQLPVRFGIHLGEVIFTKDNVFGDGVNVASRIESMGVSGGILISRTVKNQIANKPEFSLKPMGAFQFKNVKEPLEVFAVANEGIVVPRREELQGKFEATKPRSKVGQVMLVVIILLAAISGIWFLQPKKATLTEAQRSSYLAILPFENKTGEDGLEVFGDMISDRLTSQLMETGEVKILAADNLKKEVAEAGVGSIDIPEFFAGNGVGMIITGRFYTQDNELYVQASIIDTKTGQVVHAPSPVIGLQDNKREIMEELSGIILSFWEVRDLNRFKQNPPRFEAYREFLAGQEDFDQAYQGGGENYWLQAEAHYLKAFELDSTFLSPLLRLHVVYHNLDRFQEKDSLFVALEARKNSMTLWEQKSFEFEWERNYGTALAEAEAAATMFEMDPSHEISLGRAFTAYVMGNYPGKAISFWKKAYPMALNEFKSKWKPNGWLGWPLFLLREFDSIEAMYQEDIPSIDRIPTKNALYAEVLVQTGQYEKVPERVLRAPEFGPVGKPEVLYWICNGFMLKGEATLARTYASQLKEFALANQDKPYYFKWLGEAEMFLKNYREAAQYLERFLESDWDRRVQADLVACYAYLGESKKIDNLLSGIPQMSGKQGIIAYYHARAHAILGNTDQAIESVAAAIQGRFRFNTDTYAFDYHLKPLFDDPRFQQLVRPRG